jgi:hypothetical protein
VVGNLILKAEPAKPPVGEVQRHLLAQPTLRTEAIAVTHQEYPDHQLGIDRRPPRMAVQGRQLFVQPVHLQNAIDLPQQVIGGDAIFQAELVEQPILQTRLTPHHHNTPPSTTLLRRNHDRWQLSTEFFNSICQERTFWVGLSAAGSTSPVIDVESDHGVPERINVVGTGRPTDPSR